jgi:hypothetical protein
MTPTRDTDVVARELADEIINAQIDGNSMYLTRQHIAAILAPHLQKLVPQWVAVSEAVPCERGISGGRAVLWATNGVPVALGNYARPMAQGFGYTHWLAFDYPTAAPEGASHE